MSEIKTEYKGVEIVYHEDDSKWRYELHGKERSSDRLDSAKKAIDTQPKEKTDFTPQPAILIDWSSSKFVTVTSLAEAKKYQSGADHYWVKNQSGERSKEPASKLFSAGPANEKLLREAAALDKEARLFSKKAEAKRKEMSPFISKS